jgi:endonuclease YncB( thermonuclease family)
MQQNTITQKQYNQLLTDIKTLKQTAAEQSSSQLIQSYWKIGKRITQENLSHNANYHNSIIRNLSEQLKMERTALARCITFFTIYNTIPQNKFLLWSHYRELITIKNKALRTSLEKQANQEQWTKNQLINAIKLSTKKDPNQKTLLKRPTTPTYLYQAKVLNVIDGDTILLQIDLGFQVHKEQRIRLACLDCPELDTPEGKKSKQFLQETLANLEKIMIQTQKADIYGRYIAHIFYDPTNQKPNDKIFETGIYLNEEILQKGMGVMI